MSEHDADLDRLRLGSLLLEEGVRIQRALLRMAVEPWLRMQIAGTREDEKRPEQGRDADAEPHRDAAPGPEAELLDLLGRAERFLLAQPVACQQAFAALVAEGRRFAQTPEGERWLRALAPSELVEKARMIWSGSLLNVLEERPQTVVPSAYLELLRASALRPDRDVERWIDLLRGKEKPPGAGNP